MKRILFLLLAVMSLAMSTSMSAADKAVVTFSRTKVDVGNIKSTGGPVKFDYEFTNTGTKPLIIISVTNGGCGCTKPSFPKNPIAPGAKGKVSVSFNPSGRSGELNREIKVRTNGGNAKLRFTGVVIP